MRINNIIRNSTSGFLSVIVTQIVRFFVRTVFIYCLSEAYLGINGLFTSILNFFNIAELGIGGAIVFALYKPLSDGNKEQIKALMALYKKAYRIIGIIILVIGVGLIPFLPYIIKENIDFINIYYIYILYVINSVVSYFFFAYKAALFTADQKNHIVTLTSIPIQILTAVLQACGLVLLRNVPNISFYIYTIIGILGVIAANIIVARKVNKYYPYIKEKNVQKIDSDVKNRIYKNIGALSISRISRVALDSIDAIIISATLIGGVSIIGKYSNYIVIVSILNSVFAVVSNAITSSLGNYLVEENISKSKNIFISMNLMFNWAYGFCFICLLSLLNPFIGGIWINKNWVLSDSAVFLISLNFLINGMTFAPIKFIQSAGLYWQAKFRYIISAVMNISLSIIFVLVLKWGIEGVLFATTLSLMAMISLDPYVVYKHIFNEKPFKYYMRFLVSMTIIVSTGIFVWIICEQIDPEYTIQGFMLRMVICIVIINIIWISLTFGTREFKDTVSLLKQYKNSIIKSRQT